MTADAVIAIGASAGGVEALLALAAALPADLPAAVCVVLHTAPDARSHLATLLGRAGALPAAPAEDGAPLLAGRIYVAPPDRHLLVRPGRVEVNRGPRENRARPAVDPLFRSAARAYGPRLVAVILSGALDDGATGLLSVRARGGTIVVQDPAAAPFPGMPEAALRAVRPDHILPTAAIGPLLPDLLRRLPVEGGATMAPLDDAKETPGETLVTRDLSAQAVGGRPNEVSVYTCPECGGVMWQVGADGADAVEQFRCHTGHVYNPLSLLAQQSEDLEAALWRCVRMLTEKATLTRQLATRERRHGNATRAARIDEQVALDERHIHVLRDQLLSNIPGPPDQAYGIVAALHDGE